MGYDIFQGPESFTMRHVAQNRSRSSLHYQRRPFLQFSSVKAARKRAIESEVAKMVQRCRGRRGSKEEIGKRGGVKRVA